MLKSNITVTNKYLIAGLLVFSTQAYGHQQTEPVEYLIDFEISGVANPDGTFTINGPGFAPLWIFGSGEITDKRYRWRKAADLKDGIISFSAPVDGVVNFTCEPGSCEIRMKDGAVFTSNAGVALDGRAIQKWGPVINSPDFDPINGVFPTRILGCGGLKEIAGKGKAAGMVGSICFNGVLNFNQNNPFELTGSSKCTITVHTPDPNIPIE